MKNIHVLPTDKPSRLYKSKITQDIFISDNMSQHGDATYNLNIHITSDEEIKFNDYITDGYKVWQWKDDSSLLGRKKVILSTDQDLNGVQAIDDDFLEWFVKNPSCEEVEIDKGYRGLNLFNYKIIIPKEEPKQETLEEVADKYFPLAEKIGGETYTAYKAFIAGAKWQQGRMYNEEDIIEFAEWIINQDWDETELNFSNNSKTTKELLQKFLNSKQ